MPDLFTLKIGFAAAFNYTYSNIYVKKTKRQKDKNHTLSIKMFLRVTLDLVLSTFHSLSSGAVMANRSLLASFRIEHFS